MGFPTVPCTLTLPCKAIDQALKVLKQTFKANTKFSLVQNHVKPRR